MISRDRSKVASETVRRKTSKMRDKKSPNSNVKLPSNVRKSKPDDQIYLP